MTLDTRALFRDAWDAEIEKRRTDSPSYAIEDYVVTGRAPAPYGKRNLQWWQDNGHTLVDNWLAWRRKTRWDIWETPDGHRAIELELNVNLDVVGLVKMFIDRIFVTPTGEIVVVDIKTGRTPETAEQLGLYSTGVELTWGPAYRPTWGFFWDAHKGEHGTPQLLDRYTPEFFRNAYTEAAAGINAGCFMAKPANNCKDWCSMARYCHAVGGPDAAGVDPLASA